MNHTDPVIQELLNRPAAQPRVACFQKVSDGQFRRDMENAFRSGELGAVLASYGEETLEGLLAHEPVIKIPVRATKGSFGYDFCTPYAFTLRAGESLTVPTGIRCAIDPNYALFIGPKSGKGSKFRVMMRNTFGGIDSDYYSSDNEGHIIMKIINDNYEDRTMEVRAGESIMQGVFLPYGITMDDCADAARNGGFGSTG